MYSAQYTYNQTSTRYRKRTITITSSLAFSRSAYKIQVPSILSWKVSGTFNIPFPSFLWCSPTLGAGLIAWFNLKTAVEHEKAVQAIDGHRTCKNCVVTLWVMSQLVHVLGASRGCADFRDPTTVFRFKQCSPLARADITRPRRSRSKRIFPNQVNRQFFALQSYAWGRRVSGWVRAFHGFFCPGSHFRWRA